MCQVSSLVPFSKEFSVADGPLPPTATVKEKTCSSFWSELGDAGAVVTFTSAMVFSAASNRAARTRMQEEDCIVPRETGDGWILPSIED